MADIRIERLAKLIVSYSVNVKEEEEVIIQAPQIASPLVQEL
jgi:leucyl aminopeptidase (aminopeptidase T)